MAFVFSLTGYLGINFVLVLVRSFGALLAVTGLLALRTFLDTVLVYRALQNPCKIWHVHVHSNTSYYIKPQISFFP